MLRSRKTRVAASLLTLALLSAACTSRDDGDDDTTTGNDGDAAAESDIPTEDCATDPTQEIEGDTITLASSYPQSGQYAAYSEIARGWKAFFDKVNAEGGVEVGDRTFQIEYVDQDDQYNAGETSANIDEMFGPEGDGAFAAFSVVGTANNVAIRDTLNELCVPNLFAATGSPQWGNEDYPWMIGSTLIPYTLEAKAFADLLGELKPDATVAMLRQDDDFGDAYEEGFRQAIDGTDIELVEVQEYNAASGEVSSQISTLAATDADAFFNGAALLPCPTALTAVAESGWQPITWVSGTCTSKTLMGIAGEAGNGAYAASNIMDTLNPEWDDDPRMVEFMDTVNQYQPEGFDPQNAIVGYGYTQAAIFVEALKAAEAPTRLAVMESVRNLDGISDVGLLLPDVSVTTGGDDSFMGESMMLAQYEWTGPEARNHFVPQGDLLDFEGATRDNSPEDLINS
jgi:branched-chain amino acid transport system substrate-binding protein